MLEELESNVGDVSTHEDMQEEMEDSKIQASRNNALQLLPILLLVSNSVHHAECRL